MFRRAGILALLLVLGLATAPAGVVSLSGADSPSPLASGSSTTSGWIAWKLQTDGTRVTAGVDPVGQQGPVQVATVLYGLDGIPQAGGATTFLHADQRVYVDAEPPIGPPVQESVSVPGQPRPASAGFDWSPAPGQYVLLIWVAGTQASWSWHVGSGGGIQLLNETSGDSAFLHLAEDFTGTLNAGAYPANVGARVTVEGTKVINVQHALVAAYFSPGFQTGLVTTIPPAVAKDQISVTEPSGDSRSCTQSGCLYWNVPPASGAGPGAYTFHLTGVGAGAEGLDSVQLGGADVTFPT